MAAKRSIAVAVDAGDGSRDAFLWALDNLIREGDSVVLINARKTRPPILPPGTDPASSGGLEGDNEDGYMLVIGNIMDELTKLTHQRFPTVGVDKVIRSGDPKQVLLDEVVIRGAAALVLGSRGLGPMKRAFIGSVSDYCSRHADCAVIVVRGKASSSP